MKFLLIEDNIDIAYSLQFFMKQNGYELLIANSIKSAKIMLENEKFDLIILDIMLPDGDGNVFYKEYIKKLDIKVLFLTAVDDEEVVVDALNQGANEYMTKPFKAKELLIRIERILNKNENNIIKVGNIEYNLDKMIVTKDKKIINLTSLETKILNLLFINKNKIVSRNCILEHIWEWTGNDIDDHTITVYLKRIREKINSDIIITVKGIGYRIDVDEK